MKCTKCGRLLEEDFKFCPECAAPVPTLEHQEAQIDNLIEVDENKNIPAKVKDNSYLKKAFLITMIVSLSISALIGIAVIIIGNLGETESKILGTTLAIGGFSLVGLCCSTLYERKNFKLFSTIGMGVCVLGFIQSALMIWEVYGRGVEWEWTYKILITLIVISLSMAQASILLLIKIKNKNARTALWITIGLICALGLMILLLVYEIITDRSEFYFRFLSVVAILDALGTITTPILNKINK